MLDTEVKDCIIIGGGIAGLQAAIQLGRYSAYDVLVIDRGTGRSTICKSYRNILGWPDGVSGEELRGGGVSRRSLSALRLQTMISGRRSGMNRSILC